MSSFLTPDEIKSFRELIYKIYGIKLSDKEANDQGSRLVKLFELMIRKKKAAENLLKDC